ncbi:MAG: MFS transporter [Lachnospiraceae bacterium]|nr:MFS transporter [Lachnospiraceae bacterium]
MRKTNAHGEMTKMHVYVIIASCIMAWGVMGMVNAYGIFFTPMEEALGVNRASVTLHYSLRGLVSGLSMPLVALLLDRKVSLRITMPIGMALYLASSILIARSRSVIMVDVLAVVGGFGLALVSFMLMTVILGNWFIKSLGTFSGIAIAFSGIGSAIVSPVVTKLLGSLGYETVYILYAAAAMAMVVPILFVPLKPEDMGLKPYGADEEGDAEKIAAQGKTLKETKRRTHEINLDLPYKLFSGLYIVLLVMTLLLVGDTTLNSHLPALALNRNLTAEIGALLLSSSMVGNLVSKLVFGVMVDRIGVVKGFLVIMAASMAGFLLILLAGTSTMVLAAGSFLYGTVFTLPAMGMSFLARHIYGNEAYSAAYAKITMMTNFGGAIFVTVIGAMYDATGAYTLPVIMCMALDGISLLMLFWIAGYIKKQQK